MNRLKKLAKCLPGTGRGAGTGVAASAPAGSASVGAGVRAVSRHRLVRMGALLSLVVAGSVVAVSPPAHAAEKGLSRGFHLVKCGATAAPGRGFVIESLDSGFSTIVELGYPGGTYGELRAFSSATGRQEQYDFKCAGHNTWAIRSDANHLYVSAELGYTGADHALLRARSSHVGAWEKFYLYQKPPAGCAAICAQGQWVIQSAVNGRYVAAEENYTGDSKAELRARATAVGPWELFDIF